MRNNNLCRRRVDRSNADQDDQATLLQELSRQPRLSFGFAKHPAWHLTLSPESSAFPPNADNRCGADRRLPMVDGQGASLHCFFPGGSIRAGPGCVMRKQYIPAPICLMVAACLVVLDRTGATGQSSLPPCPEDQNQRWHDCLGTYTWPDGEKYVGEWQEEQVHGRGTFTWADGRKYVGEWKDGERNGRGTFTWADGRKYVGEWKDDKRNGQGTFTSPDGHEYVGEYKDDRPNGRGTFTWPSGAKYVGEFKDGKYDGRGTLYGPTGAVMQAGRWENNKFLGP